MKNDLSTTSRLDQIRKLMRKAGAGYLVTRDPANILILTGCRRHSPGDIIGLITPDKVILFTDKRCEATARHAADALPHTRVCIWDRLKMWDDFASNIRGGSTLAFEKDSGQTTFSFVEAMRAACAKRKITVKPIDDIIVNVRSIKTIEEIGILRRAGAISDSALKLTLTKIKPGMTESEIAQILEGHLRRLSGSSELSFETTVASGPNGACPHAGVTDRKIRRGEMITFDFGCVYRGYHADVTRTIFVGVADTSQVAAYTLVLKALLKAEKDARPGMTGQDIDKICRGMIADSEFSAWNYAHATGHGVGVDVHEKPYLSYTPPGANVLKVGSVFSIEPGIYIDGKFGLRIEDTGVMTINGFQSFNRFPKGIVIV